MYKKIKKLAVICRGRFCENLNDDIQYIYTEILKMCGLNVLLKYHQTEKCRKKK